MKGILVDFNKIKKTYVNRLFIRVGKSAYLNNQHGQYSIDHVNGIYN